MLQVSGPGSHLKGTTFDFHVLLHCWLRELVHNILPIHILVKFSIPIEEPLPGIPRIWGVQIETQHVKAAALEMLLLFQSFPTLCDPVDCSMPGIPVPHHLLKFTQVHVCYFGDAIQPSHPLMPSSSALNLSQHQRLFQWVSCSNRITKILEFQLQHQSFQWAFEVDFP